MGKQCQICEGVLITDPLHTQIGDKVIINDGVIIQSCEGAEIRIGNNVTLSYGVRIITGGLILSTEGAIQQLHAAKPICIQDRVWIGTGAIILSGVNVGTGAVIAAGSVVNRDVEPYTVVAGVPARKVKQLRADQGAS